MECSKNLNFGFICRIFKILRSVFSFSPQQGGRPALALGSKRKNTHERSLNFLTKKPEVQVKKIKLDFFSKTPKEKIGFYIFTCFLILCSAISLFTTLSFFHWAWYLLESLLLWIAADFITGIIHWWEDTYGNPNWKIIGKYVVEPNLIHHKEPHKLLEGSYWTRINTSFFAAALIGAILFLAGWCSWQVILCLLFCIQGNEIHAMSHRGEKKTYKLVRFLQNTGLFQSKKMHRWHHKAPYETNFCIMTDFANPILNKIKFWTGLEYLILKCFKIPVLRASSLRNGL